MSKGQRRTFALIGAVLAAGGLLTVWQFLRTDRYVPPWGHGATEAHGFDRAALDELRAGLQRRDTDALLIVRHGRIVEEWYRARGGASRRFGTASAAKALVGGMAAALAVCDGTVRLDDPAHAYITAWADHPKKSAISVRHLASHSSGLAHDAPAGEAGPAPARWAQAFWGRSPDLFPLTLEHAPVLFPPGTRYAYSGPAYAALAYVLTAALKDGPQTTIRALLRERIMTPLGIPEVYWSIGYGTEFEMDGMTLHALWGGGSYTARAAARVGQLLVQQGVWEGKTLLRPECIERTVRYGGTPLPGNWRDARHPAPAVGWWSNAEGAWRSLPRDAFAGIGAGHQVVLVVPSLQLVAVRYGGKLGRTEWDGDFWIALDRHLVEPLAKALRPQ